MRPPPAKRARVPPDVHRLPHALADLRAFGVPTVCLKLVALLGLSGEIFGSWEALQGVEYFAGVGAISEGIH